MSTLVFVTDDGESRSIDVSAGESVMQVAIDSGIEEILGDCGGACSCATCHCYVEQGVFPAAEQTELDMLELVTHRKPNSRLGCQLKIEECDGDVIIGLPVSQE